MKGLTLFTLLFCFAVSVSAQSPEWINQDFRSNEYPKSSFLVGYTELTDVNKKEAEAELKNLIADAKSELIQSVKVQVKSVSTSKVSDFNGQVDDYFNQKTTSESSLQLIGLQTESYYDKKSKKAYALAYVNKSKMAEYYRSEIGQYISDINAIITQSQELLDGGNLKRSFKNGLDAYNKFFAINESQNILRAIGASRDLDTRADEVNELNARFSKLMLQIQTDKRMSMDALGFIIANGLLKFQGDHHKGISYSSFTYEQTGFTSDFSYKLDKSIKQSLMGDDANPGYHIAGEYSYADGNILVESKILDVKTNHIIGRVSSQITEAELIHNQVEIIPQDVKNMALLESMKITSKTVGASGKAGIGLDKDLVALVEVNGEPSVGVPVKFFNNNGGVVYCATVTDEKGIATCKVKKISGEYKNQVIVAEVNLSEFLMNDSAEYVTNILKNKELPKASYKVVVIPSTIFIKAEENNFGNSLDVKLIEPQIKETLASQGFDFKDNSEGADYIIKIRASSRKGGQVSAVYFAYVDVTISVYDNIQGKEIYKESITNVKGGGGSFDQAGGKAFYTASDQVKEKIVEIMVE
tara:strand:+ start:120752 stop:122503 length:1752 start_codon:yes stop_codon:yes gene_type:complete